jgi:hypothetical protein
MPEGQQADDRLAETLEAHGLQRATVLYRETLEEFLSYDDASGEWSISANPDPSEAVIDVYAGGHVALAAQIGPGLAFTTRRGSEWASDHRVTVALELGDALDQGGLVYPVESVITDTVWYVTLPDGRVRVSRD